MKRSREPSAIAPFLSDESRLGGGHAEAVLWPESAGEVAEALAGCHAGGTPVTVSGGGTGVAGGRVPRGGVVLATDRLNRIGPMPEPGSAEPVVEVEAGVPLAELQRAASAAGWLYPPDPTETGAFLGGTLATNASGARSFRFGATRAWVREVAAVLADGRTLRVRRGEVLARDGLIEIPLAEGGRLAVPAPDWRPPATRKNAAGYHPGPDAIDLLIGSEGTLAVIVSARVALLPAPAGWVSGLIAFRDERAALRFVRAARAGEEGVMPAALEFLDGASLALLEQRGAHAPRGAGAAVIVEEALGAAHREEAALERYAALAERHGALADSWLSGGAEDRRRIRALRHELPVAINATLAERGLGKVATDTAVPEGRLPEMLGAYRRAIGRARIDAVVFGHAGDDHLHVNLLPRDEGEAVRSRRLRDELTEIALSMGGTVSAEHGVGKIKREALAGMYGPEALASMRAVKRAFDPAGILGPGTLLPE